VKFSSPTIFQSLFASAILLKEVESGGFDELTFDIRGHNFDLRNLGDSEREKVDKACIGWQDINSPGTIAVKFDHSKSFDELKRDSTYKQKAFDAGLIRPFLLLVSMHPIRRAGVAKMINFDYVRESWFGDAHHEAWYILSGAKGIQGRASEAFSRKLNPLRENCNWYEIVYRVAYKAFVHRTKKVIKNKDVSQASRKEIKDQEKSWHKSIHLCMDPDDRTTSNLEELFLRMLLEYLKQNLPEEGQTTAPFHKGTVAKGAAHPDVPRLRTMLKKADFENEELIDFASAIGALGAGAQLMNSVQVNKYVDSKKEGKILDTVMIAIPITMLCLSAGPAFMAAVPAVMLARNSFMAVFEDTPGYLLGPMVAMMLHRVWLALGDVGSLSQFYPADAKQRAMETEEKYKKDDKKDSKNKDEKAKKTEAA